MGMAAAAVAAFGLFTLVGGIIGYVKAQSRISLVSGSISGLLLWACALGIAQQSLFAAIVSIVITLLLGGRFANQWHRSRKLMPDLLMVIFSTATLLALAAGLIVFAQGPEVLPRVMP